MELSALCIYGCNLWGHIYYCQQWAKLFLLKWLVLNHTREMHAHIQYLHIDLHIDSEGIKKEPCDVINHGWLCFQRRGLCLQVTEQQPATRKHSSLAHRWDVNTFLNWLNAFALCALDQTMLTQCCIIPTNSQIIFLRTTPSSTKAI